MGGVKELVRLNWRGRLRCSLRRSARAKLMLCSARRSTVTGDTSALKRRTMSRAVEADLSSSLMSGSSSS